MFYLVCLICTKTQVKTGNIFQCPPPQKKKKPTLTDSRCIPLALSKPGKLFPLFPVFVLCFAYCLQAPATYLSYRQERGSIILSNSWQERELAYFTKMSNYSDWFDRLIRLLSCKYQHIVWIYFDVINEFPSKHVKHQHFFPKSSNMDEIQISHLMWKATSWFILWLDFEHSMRLHAVGC